MERINTIGRAAGSAACTAIAAALLAGCAAQGQVATNAGSPLVTADVADSVLAKAEARVAKSRRNATDRTDLAQLYLSQGRFASAATTFEDAVALGASNPRNGLGLALAYAGMGRNADALAVLGQWRSQIPAGDFGLALALAGRPADGVEVLTDTIRGGQANAKTRQNLAFAYALDGRWGQARLIASQDVPADQLDTRLAEWGSRARPDQGQERIANLLGAPLRNDPGQPVALALNAAPQAKLPVLATMEPAAPSNTELPAQADLATTASSQDQGVALALAPPPRQIPAQFTAPSSPIAMPPTMASAKYLTQPRVKPVPAASRTFTDSFGNFAAGKGTSHLVQLGSFSTAGGAQRAKAIFLARDASLKAHALRVTEAQVNGRRFYRVSAEGFDRGSAQSLCGAVKRRGGACLAYSGKLTLPGALPAARGPQLAIR